MIRRRLAVVFALAAMQCGCATPQLEDSDLPSRDLVHSDLPLFAQSGDEFWPRSIVAVNEIGCESRVAFGDWKLQDKAGEYDDEWYRIHNYGAFHCFALTRTAYDRQDLEGSDSEPSFFVKLDTIDRNGKDLELWILQVGAMPGSDYLLLSRMPSDGRIEYFDVLQRRCPKQNYRQGKNLDILRTDYCAINSRRELVEFAKRMAAEPPLATFTFSPTKAGN